MTYKVTITSTDGNTNSYACAGSNDREALISAGKVVRVKADPDDPEARVSIRRDGQDIGPASTVGEITRHSS